MKYLIRSALIALFLFGASLLIGVLIFTAISFSHEFNQAPHKLTYIFSIPGALVFMTGAAILIFWMPGFFSATFAGLFLAARFGKFPEIALLGSSLIGFYTFKGFFNLTPYLFGSSGKQSFNEIFFGLAACGFGLSACFVSLFLLKQEAKTNSKSQKFILIRTLAVFVIFITAMAYYFRNR
jgi:hypothetical protein